MGLIIDIAFILIAVITLVHHTKKGFILTVFRFGNLVVSVIVASLAGPAVATWISERYIAAPMRDMVVSALENLVAFSSGSFENSFAAIMSRLPEWLSNLIRSTNAEEALSNLAESAMRNIEKTANVVSAEAASIVSSAISYAALFVLTYLLMKFIIVPLLDKIFDLPVLNSVNTCLGFLVGVMAAGIYVMLLAYLVSFLARFCSPDVSESIRNSTVINFVTNSNIFSGLN